MHQDVRPRRRGRPRAYDPDLALDQVLDVFWRYGFSATSLDMIAEATNMNRPSLANAFGDKRALYLRSLERFRARMKDLLGAKLASETNVRKALLGFYRRAIDLYFSGDVGPRGCFAITTAAAESVEDPEIRAALAAVLAEIDLALEMRLRQAAEAGELARGADLPGLAKIGSATLHSLALRARAGESRRSLETMASAAADLMARR